MMKTGKPEGFSFLTPCLTVKDVEKSMTFCSLAFRMTLGEAMKGESGLTEYGEMRYQEESLMFVRQGAHGKTEKTPKESGVSSPVTLYLYCANVDDLFAHATRSGVQAIMPPTDMFWGDRMCQLQDLDGYIWSFATHPNA